MHHFAFQQRAEEHHALLRHLHIDAVRLLERVDLEGLTDVDAPLAAAILLGPSLVRPAADKREAKAYARAAWRALS